MVYTAIQIYQIKFLAVSGWLWLRCLQSVGRKKSFLFVGDVNTHHGECLGSSATNLHGRTARDFTSLSGCEQMVTERTHIDGGRLDLVLTAVPDL